MSLRQKGVSTQKSGAAVTNYAQNGMYDVLYLTPEKAMSLPNRYRYEINKYKILIQICLH